MKNRHRPGTTHSGGQTRVIWDDSKARVHHPKVLNVSGGREEIILSFGCDQALEVGQDADSYQLSDRIVMSPFTAKRLVTMLKSSVSEYESRYGSLDMESSPPIVPGEEPPLPADFSKARKSDQKSGLLLQLVKELGVDVGLERSFKISDKTLLGNRFLLGSSKRAIGQKPDGRILRVCERMDMPDNLLEAFKEYLYEANYVHFGFEENVKTCIYKVYLELYDKVGKKIKVQPRTSDGFLLHLGFKWDVSDNTNHALTKYTWYPFLSVDEIRVRLSQILDSAGHSKPLEIATDILSKASSRIPDRDILYLEVSEENNPRRSFDINMYKANVRLKDLHPLLSKICEHYSIPLDKFQALYDQAMTKTFGHLSGGIDREGRDFLTVYYGVEGYSIQKHNINGSLEGQPLPTTKPDRPRSILRPFPKAGPADQKAILLLQLAENLNVTYGFERSFKIYEKTLLPNRFLVALNKNTIGHRPDERMLEICEKIDMPGDFLKDFQRNLSEASGFFFGIEENESTCVYKAYIEFWDKVTAAVRSKPDKLHPMLLFLGFKWDAFDNTKGALARYTCFPLISVEMMLEKISDILQGDGDRSSFEIAKGMIDLASTRAAKDRFIYLEVAEEGNPRRSFDINIYDANLHLKEIYPYFLKMCRHYSISPGEFHSIYEPVQTHILGHISGGIDREGRDFLTVYFGKKVASNRLGTGT